MSWPEDTVTSSPHRVTGISMEQPGRGQLSLLPALGLHGHLQRIVAAAVDHSAYEPLGDQPGTA